MLQYCVCRRRRLSVVCTECIVAKRSVLEQKLLLRAYRKSYMDSYADIDGVGGGVWVKFHGGSSTPISFSWWRRRRHNTDRWRRRSAPANHLQEVYKKLYRGNTKQILQSLCLLFVHCLIGWDVTKFLLFCMPVIITQEVIYMPNIHFDHSC